MSPLRLVQRIIVLALALSAVALILVVVGIPAVLIWSTFKKEGTRKT